MSEFAKQWLVEAVIMYEVPNVAVAKIGLHAELLHTKNQLNTILASFIGCLVVLRQYLVALESYL